MHNTTQQRPTLEYTTVPPQKRRFPVVYIIAAVAFAVCGIAVVLIFHQNTGNPPKDTDFPDWIQQNFITPNDYSRPGSPIGEITGITVHYVGNPGTTAAQNRSYFERLSSGVNETYASSHFIIGLDGEIVQCIPLDEIAYATIGRNSDTISIECCHPDDDGEFNDATYASLLKLVDWLCGKYGLDSGDLLRHYDVTGKECPRYYVRNPDAWEKFLTDTDNVLAD